MLGSLISWLFVKYHRAVLYQVDLLLLLLKLLTVNLDF